MTLGRFAVTLVAAISCTHSFAQDAFEGQSVSISASGGVEFVVRDGMGRRSGFDPTLNQKFTEINNSYGEFSVDSENPNVEPPEPVMEFMTSRPVEGPYKLSLYGTKVATYRLSITLGRSIRDVGKEFVFRGVIDTGQVISYDFEYHLAMDVPFAAARVVQESTLREDLTNCYKLKLLGQRELYADLSRRADKFEKYLSREDSLKAQQELMKLKKKIEDVHKKTDKSVDKKKPTKREFVSEDAFKILDEDIKALLEQLPEHRKGKGWEREKDDGKGGKERRD